MVVVATLRTSAGIEDPRGPLALGHYKGVLWAWGGAKSTLSLGISLPLPPNLAWFVVSANLIKCPGEVQRPLAAERWAWGLHSGSSRSVSVRGQHQEGGPLV